MILTFRINIYRHRNMLSMLVVVWEGPICCVLKKKIVRIGKVTKIYAGWFLPARCIPA